MSSTGEQQRAVDGTKLIPLLYYIQKIESDIHELDNDVVVDKIIETEFSPGAIFILNKDPMEMQEFKAWLAGYRSQYDYLDISFHNPVVAPSDPEGRGGTVGLTARWKGQGKNDRILYESQLVAIFEVTWFDDPGRGGPAHGERMITKAFGAFGDINPATEG
uniref:SnoaL-like domain-containing protein n=1 Tax=Bionectria ochroleuca TaxID=29856 RepID=A0A8H7K3E0_BIOOC